MSVGRSLWKSKKRFSEKKKMISQGIKKLRKRSLNSLTSNKNLQSEKLPFEHEFDNKAISKLMETKDLEMEIKDSKTDTNYSKIDSKKIAHTKQLAVTPTTSAKQITRKNKLSSGAQEKGSLTTVQVIVTNEDMMAKTVGTSKPDTSKAKTVGTSQPDTSKAKAVGTSQPDTSKAKAFDTSQPDTSKAKTVGTSQPDTSKAKAFDTSQPDTSKAKAVGTSQPDTSKAKAVGTSQPVTAMDDGKKKKSFGMGIFKRTKKTESFSFTEGTELEVSQNVAVELQSVQPNKTVSEVDKDSANGTASSAVSASSISSIYTSVKAVTSEGFSYSPFSGLGSGKLVTSYDSCASSSAVMSPDVSSRQVSYLGSAGSYVRVASIGQALGDHFNSLAGTFFTKRATLIVSNQQNIEITLPNEEHPLTEAPLGWTCVLEENVNVMTTFQPGILYISLSSLCFKPTDIASSQWIIIDLSKITQVVKSKKAQWIPGRNMSDHIQITVEGVNKPYIFGSVSSFDECYKVIMVHGKAHNYEWAEEFREIPHVFLNNTEYHFSLAGLYQSIRN
ncbi:hypothetical protein LSAT2_008717 [Lamellibrachia satsuma]|nr:hypothetical protein LSAT2_008717 [Lamellibrachia satsuma]